MRPSTPFILSLTAIALVSLFLACPVQGGNSKTAAKKTQCLSNIKQLAQALLLYKHDHDGSFPLAQNWMDVTEGSLRDNEIPSCPEIYVQGKPQGFGYSLNKFLAGKKAPQDSEQPLVYESTQTQRNASGYLLDLPNPGRHNGTNTVAFSDGHAKAFPSLSK